MCIIQKQKFNVKDKKMLPIDKNLQNMPPLYAQESVVHPILYARYYLKECDWGWYVMEYSPLQQLCFGLVVGDEMELGYFCLDELERLQQRCGMEVVRDYQFKPTILKELQNGKRVA